MKKSLIFLATAFLLNASVAKSLPPPPLLDDSASFRIAKSVKLGYGENSRHLNKGIKTSEFKACSSDDNCPTTQECVDGKCKNLCSPNPCPEQKPNCEAKDHSYTCSCTETSCGAGKECVNGKCESCTVGSKCSCDGGKVLGTSGTCVCPTGLSCSAGKYIGSDCSCENCPENDTRENKCGCPGNTVPDGNGSCYCKTPKNCGEGYTFDRTNTCECIACTGNNPCDNPCPTGTVPTADGCKAYACATDDDCPAGNRCENGGTESAQCVPCGKNEQCRCDEGYLSDGTGKCVPVACKTGLICSTDITEQCCDAGMQCVNPDTVESYCAACEVDTQCTCPDGYLVNKEGKCVKPECKTNSDCPNGKYCENPGKSNAKCVPCAKGETCTCTSGMVADGNGGCKLGCTFDSASLCVSGTTNCKTCTQSGGCYTCTDCKDGYYPDNGTCVPCKQKFGNDCKKCTPNKCTICENGYEPDPYTGKCKAKSCPSGYSTSPSCSNGQITENSSYYSGTSVCKKCVNCNAGEQCACPAGQLADGKGGCKSVNPCANVTCDGGKVCSAGSCVCPNSAPYTDGSGKCQPCLQDSHCKNNQTCSNYQCVDLKCDPECQDAFNHQCNNKPPPPGYKKVEKPLPGQPPAQKCGTGEQPEYKCGYYTCKQIQCPSGFIKAGKGCPPGQKFVPPKPTENVSPICGRCITDCSVCFGDYPLDMNKTSCSSGQKVEYGPRCAISDGYIAKCGKCVDITCSGGKQLCHFNGVHSGYYCCTRERGCGEHQLKLESGNMSYSACSAVSGSASPPVPPRS